jgi:hypothetical protein
MAAVATATALTGVFAAGALTLIAPSAPALESGTCHADESSVCSGSGTALNDSVSSGDAVAINGSVASGCSVAINDSTASGGSVCPPPVPAVPTPAHVTPAAPAAHAHVAAPTFAG